MAELRLEKAIKRVEKARNKSEKERKKKIEKEYKESIKILTKRLYGGQLTASTWVGFNDEVVSRVIKYGQERMFKAFVRSSSPYYGTCIVFEIPEGALM